MNYRNFIRRPDNYEQFGYDRQDRLRLQAQKLDVRMALPFDDKALVFNPNIPSGYTYFAQFVAHDCILSSPSTPIASSLGIMVENKRQKLLHLDTLYGGGPEEFPEAYFAHRVKSSVRSKFKLSRPSLPDEHVPFRDIGRATSLRSNAAQAGTIDSMVADARNDIHAAISQITALFQMFHNLVVDRLEEMHDCRRSQSQDMVGHALFHNARHITTKVYRNNPL